jgi:hypothetical protein
MMKKIFKINPFKYLGRIRRLGYGKTMMYFTLLMFFMVLVCSFGITDNIYSQGVRKFSAVPPIGVHPRVLMSPEDIPAWRENVIKTHKGKEFFSKRYKSEYIDRLASTDPNTPEDQLLKLFPEAGPVHDPLFAAMDVMYHQDKERAAYVVRALATFSRIVIARSKLDPRWGKITSNIGGVKGLNGISAGLGHLWLRGGSSFALAYDFLYNDMTEEQRSLCRKALATATKDLVTWGMGFPKGRAVSNWYLYHGELGVMLLAIEGEGGFDKARYDMFTEMMRNWFDVSLHPGGGGNEDGYMANTSFREGTFSMIAMARRGENLFLHPGYQKYWEWVIQSLIPGEHGGLSVSYACNSVNPYESMPALSRWALPGNPLVNYYYRQYKGADYAEHNNWQYSDMSTLFAMDWEDTPEMPLDVARLKLPLTAEYDQLGLMITRSEWSDNCLYLNFYCRMDAWMDRHENVDRGRFVVCADRRQWIGSYWNKVESTENESIIHIDGKGQKPLSERGRMIVPNGNMISRYDSPLFTAGCMDLKRCYDWQWCNSFKNPGAGWEPETSTFEQLGWVWQKAVMPKSMNGGDDPENPKYNFTGFNFWRKVANPVRYAFRTCALARGPHPYVIIVDDIRKDSQKHLYESYLQIPDDVALTKLQDGTYVLTEFDQKTKMTGPRKMLIQMLGKNNATIILEEYEIPDTRGKSEKRKRVVIKTDDIIPDFKILFYPFSDEKTLPKITSGNGKSATLSWTDQKDVINFTLQDNGLTQVNVIRDNKPVFTGFKSFKIYPSANTGAN